MANDNLLQIDPEQRRLPLKRPQQEDMMDLKKTFYMLFSNWYYFLIALIVALIAAYLYNSYSIPVYRVSTTLLIDEEKKGSLTGNNQLLEGIGLGEGTKNLDNQIMILSSKTLIGKTLDELPFDVEYYRQERFKKIALYPKHPINVIPVTLDSLPGDIEFTFKNLADSMFRLDAKSKDLDEFHIKASFGEIIKTPGGRFRIDLSSDARSDKFIDNEMQFIIHSRKRLVVSYSKQLKVDVVSKLGTIVKISLEGSNKEMNTDFLNKLTEIFLNNSLDKKNQEAIRTIQFIDDQLIGISDSLVITENKLQQFRSANKVMDLSKQGQVIINQAMSLDNEKARLGIEANYYNYLAEYVSKDNAGEVPIAPATMGITDPGLTKLVADLAVIQGQFYSKSLGEKNPLQSQLAQRVHNLKEALMETLNGVRRANVLARLEVNSQIRTVNAQATALPVTERQLLGIERKFKLNDELYTFLLEKRAGAQIQKASNLPDNEVIDPADADVFPVKPKKILVYFLAVIAGFGIPLFWVWTAEAFNNKVRADEDIKKITDIPITGHIPHCLQKKNTTVLDEPHSHVAEAFRTLRSRMQFFTKETKTPVILITSSMPEEGKTFAAINLASVYSLMGKKTVLIGFDLRRPKIYSDFDLGNEQGVSTWLIGKDELPDIIKETSFENLFIIPSGPIPPNPSELTALDKTNELLILLKDKFEYIIIDSSPIGTVSDSFHLASLADTCLLIVRQNLTFKDVLENTIKELKISDIKSLSLVVNDLGPDGKSYSYGRKYGYPYNNEKIRKIIEKG
jgi:capsular exopolysaccharide synthesis family protein